MMIYDYRCHYCSHTFEAMVLSMTSDNPHCTCGGPTERIIRNVTISGTADPGPPREQMPKSWNATRGGDTDTLKYWHNIATKRQKLEEKHPELAGDERPILAHEGIFSQTPLRAGDDVSKAIKNSSEKTQEGGSK